MRMRHTSLSAIVMALALANEMPQIDSPLRELPPHDPDFKMPKKPKNSWGRKSKKRGKR